MMKAKLLGVAALLMLLGAAPARANNISYDINYFIGELGKSLMSGTITTNGDLGILQAEDIVEFEITKASAPKSLGPTPFTVTYGSATGGFALFYPNSLTATESNLFFLGMRYSVAPPIGYTPCYNSSYLVISP